MWWETAFVTTQHLDQTDLARRWRLSPRTLERWRWLGQGPRFLKIGGRVVYRLDEIEAVRGRQPAREHDRPARRSARRRRRS